MEPVWSISVCALWAIVILNLLLTFRLTRWQRSLAPNVDRTTDTPHLPEVAVGSPAPRFRAKDLFGQVVDLESYAGHAVAFLFLSPSCEPCTRKVPMLASLAELATARAGVEFVVVSDKGARQTSAWIRTIQEEGGVRVDLPVLIAPRARNRFYADYNPRSIVPYFCLVSEDGVVVSRDTLGSTEWLRVQHGWQGARVPVLVSAPANWYR